MLIVVKFPKPGLSGSNNGGPYPGKVEHNEVLCVSRIHRASWTKSTIDPALRARLRREKSLKIHEIAHERGVSVSTIGRRIRKL